jgi:hypothetical protein
MAKAHYHLGDLRRSGKELNHAAALCRSDKNDLQLAHVELTRLGLFLGVNPLEATFASLPELRRLARIIHQRA